MHGVGCQVSHNMDKWVVSQIGRINNIVDDIDTHVKGVTVSWANNDITYAELDLADYIIYYIKLQCPFVCVCLSVPPPYFSTRKTATKYGTHMGIDPGIIRTQICLTHPTPRGILWCKKFKRPEKCNELPRKKPHPTWGGGQMVGKFH